ncbi:MAG: PH domain-containing protein [bacterium]|nr:PH domain-containing protein [bacterium]
MEEPELAAPSGLPTPEPTADPIPESASTATATPTATVEYRLHPKAPKVWTIVASIVAAFPLTGGTITFFALELYWAPPLLAVLAVVVVWLLTRYFRRYARTVSCQLSPLGLLIRRGVWWRAEIFVPRERVQHTDVDQGPLARRFGMASLKVFTAGSEHSQIEIDSLRHSEALAVRDELIDRSVEAMNDGPGDGSAA